MFTTRITVPPASHQLSLPYPPKMPTHKRIALGMSGLCSMAATPNELLASNPISSFPDSKISHFKSVKLKKPIPPLKRRSLFYKRCSLFSKTGSIFDKPYSLFGKHRSLFRHPCSLFYHRRCLFTKTCCLFTKTSCLFGKKATHYGEF